MLWMCTGSGAIALWMEESGQPFLCYYVPGDVYCTGEVNEGKGWSSFALACSFELHLCSTSFPYSVCVCKSHAIRPLSWRREWCCQLPEMHFTKIAVKMMFFVGLQDKDVFPQLDVSSAEHLLPLFACFRNIFYFGLAHLRTKLCLSSWLTSCSWSTVSSFFFGETKLERVLQNQLVSLYCSLCGCCELSWIPSCTEVTSKQFDLWVSSRVLFSHHECFLRKTEFCCTIIELQGSWLFGNF